jgi:hypothetical protein
MVEIALLFCFIAVLSALVSVIRGVASISGLVARSILKRVVPEGTTAESSVEQSRARAIVGDTESAP